MHALSALRIACQAATYTRKVSASDMRTAHALILLRYVPRPARSLAGVFQRRAPGGKPKLAKIISETVAMDEALTARNGVVLSPPAVQTLPSFAFDQAITTSATFYLKAGLTVQLVVLLG